MYRVGLRSNRPLKDTKDKVPFPITARQSGSVGNIQLGMGGWRVQRRRRKIKGNLTVFITQKERGGNPKHHSLRYEILSSQRSSAGSVCSSFSGFCSPYINFKCWNEHAEYIHVELSTFHLHFVLAKQISIHLVGWNTLWS